MGTPGSSGGPGPTRARRRRRVLWGKDAQYHYTDPARSWSSLALLVITLLLLAAIGGSWWQTQFQAIASGSYVPAQTIVVAFDLGGSVRCATTGWSGNFNPCVNITDRQVGTRGEVYAGMNDVIIALTVAGAIACLLATLGMLGVRISRVQLTLEILLVLCLAIVPFGLMGISAALGPGPQASSYCTFLSANVTSCPYFWGGSSAGTIPGSCTTCFLTLGWGSGVAFYEALGAAILAAVTVGFLWRGRHGPFTVAENRAWLQSNEPLKLPAATAPTEFVPGAPGPPAPPGRPPVSALHPRLRISGRPWNCPQCGRVNSGWARICTSCRGERPVDPPPGRAR